MGFIKKYCVLIIFGIIILCFFQYNYSTSKNYISHLRINEFRGRIINIVQRDKGNYIIVKINNSIVDSFYLTASSATFKDCNTIIGDSISKRKNDLAFYFYKPTLSKLKPYLVIEVSPNYIGEDSEIRLNCSD